MFERKQEDLFSCSHLEFCLRILFLNFVDARLASGTGNCDFPNLGINRSDYCFLNSISTVWNPSSNQVPNER